MGELVNFSALSFSDALISLGILALFAVAGWIVSLARKDVSIVDSMWSLMFIISLATYMIVSGSTGWRALLVLGLTSVWAIRLSAYITWRNHGAGEDHRYQQIRANNQPNFAFKSLYIVFGLQALLAWIISFPLLAAASSNAPPGWLDLLGVALWSAGMFFEVVGDAQLARFKSNPNNKGSVMNQGLWRYTRHPNYFGEFVLQWGFFVMALAAGGAWTIFAPVLISVLLLRVSGVALLEKDISNRRPAYREYIRSTNAFFPGRPKSIVTEPALFIILTLGLILPMSPVPAEASTPGKAWSFQVYVNDKPVGQHRFQLTDVGDTRYIKSDAEFEYKVLFLSLYNYEHENREVWESGCLSSIKSSTDANGKLYAVRGAQNGDDFVVEGNQNDSIETGCLSTFAYWDQKFLESEQLLNAQTGELVDITVTDLNMEELLVGSQVITTQRYRLDAGEVKIDLWYTPEGDWVGLETQPREGRIMRYVLQ